jgi:hypothetical protein
MLWTAIAGIWNIITSIMRWKLPDRIRQRDPAIPMIYQSIAQLVVLGVVNVLLGVQVFGGDESADGGAEEIIWGVGGGGRGRMSETSKGPDGLLGTSC